MSLIDAHIIPKSFHNLDNSLGVPVIVSSDKTSFPKKSQTGIYDQNILCGKCDGQLGNLEEYVLNHMVKATPEKFEDSNAPGRIYIDLDNRKVIDFVIALAFKIGLSDHEAYKNIELGPYTKRFRNHLVGETQLNGVALSVAEYDNQHPPLLNPDRVRFDAVNYLRIYAARFIFYLRMDGRPTPSYLIDVKPNESTIISIVRNWDKSKEKRVMRGLALGNLGMEKVLERWRNKRVQK